MTAGNERWIASTSLTFFITNVITSSVPDHKSTSRQRLWLGLRWLLRLTLCRHSLVLVGNPLYLESVCRRLAPRHRQYLPIRRKLRGIGIVPVGSIVISNRI